MTENQLNDFYDNNFSTPRDFNFTFSSMLLLMTIMANNLPATKDAEKNEKIKFFFEEILNLKRDDADLITDRIIKEKSEDFDDDLLEESETFSQAKNKKEFTKDDKEFLYDFFTNLDRICPALDEQIISFSNQYSSPSKKIFTNIPNIKKPKFPVEKLYVEIEEEKEESIKDKEENNTLIVSIECSLDKPPKQEYEESIIIVNP